MSNDISLISFAKWRNVGAALRLIVSGVRGGGLLIADCDDLPAMSRPQKSTGGDDESKPLSQGFIP